MPPTLFRFVCSKLEEKLVFDIRYEPSKSTMLMTNFFWPRKAVWCGTKILLSSLVWRFVFSFFSSDWYFFSKQFPISFQLDSDGLFPSNPSSSFSIFSRGLGDKCTPGPRQSPKTWICRGSCVQKKVGDPSLGSKKIPSWELTYPLKSPFWRWFSFSPGGTC